jgi:cytoskeletal protein CcmA (bactofilin family)
VVMKSKNGINDKQVPNIIAQGTNIIGDIESDGDFRIEGSVKGKITAKGRIVVGASGNVDGEINCGDADIFGSVKGNLEVISLTVLKATAVFSGDVTTKRISIEPGAIFTGTCQMKPEAKVVEKK